MVAICQPVLMLASASHPTRAARVHLRPGTAARRSARTAHGGVTLLVDECSVPGDAESTLRGGQRFGWSECYGLTVTALSSGYLFPALLNFST